MTQHLPAILAHINAEAPAAEARLCDWLRIPSISAQPAHAGDCRRAAEWMRDQLAAIGFTAGLRPTADHPVVVGHHPGPGPGAPHLLFYGHYDVQPADPLALWTSPPFEPAIVQGPHGPRVVARGAVDDKGQTMMWLEALRAWHAIAGGPPCRVTVLVEGEEEVGSPSLDAFLAANRAELAADVAVISDTGMWDIDTPAITTRLRGMVYAQIDLRAARRDLHSGLYGGSALNPINLLTRILGELQDDDGRVRIPGFYEGIAEIGPQQAAEWAALGFDEGAYLGDIGLSVPSGERDRAALERLWARPTADLNGIWGGYTGEGSKTVIAAEAHAKLSCRLVPGQDPARVAEGIRRFVAERLPADASAEVTILTTTPGIEVPAESRWVRAARVALAEEYGRPAVLIGSGGSIPVVESMRRLLGLNSLLVGFGLADDQVHSPNEKFELRCFHQGTRSHARMLAAFAG
ncbi:dipeptidase [Siccirubricoccus sp. G192]|uniref:dipeptidase n=1 Tax=Siccirubricoccus sp. G192 TaxID=2849651 RepID=UPI001C2BB67B|nr:dipeptidase [Siccirubricoccus sp. G192]MBV1798758.1 dipeptidase [Siccirubricoccus sp. G192]